MTNVREKILIWQIISKLSSIMQAAVSELEKTNLTQPITVIKDKIKISFV